MKELNTDFLVVTSDKTKNMLEVFISPIIRYSVIAKDIRSLRCADSNEYGFKEIIDDPKKH